MNNKILTKNSIVVIFSIVIAAILCLIIAFVCINKKRKQAINEGQLDQNDKDPIVGVGNRFRKNIPNMNPPLSTEISKKIFYNKKFDEAYDSYVNSIKRKSENDLKDLGIENSRDLIQILLVLELKRDQYINNNKKKIDFINGIGEILTEEGDFRKKVFDFINNSGSNVKNIDVLKKNIGEFLNIKFSDQSNNFKKIDRTYGKDDEGVKKHRTKRQDGFIKLEIESGAKNFNVYIKKILKPGLNKDFSDSKYFNIHMIKYEKIVTARKILDLSKITFPIQNKNYQGNILEQWTKEQVLNSIQNNTDTFFKKDENDDNAFEIIGNFGCEPEEIRWIRFIDNQSFIEIYKRGGDIYNELYASEIIKILFPEYYYKIRKLNTCDNSRNAIMFKIVEDAHDIDFEGDDVDKLKLNEEIDKQSFFDAMALLLFFNLNDRCMRNFMYRKDSDGNAKFFNIDFELLKENSNKFANDFENLFSLIKNIDSNRKNIVELLLKHINDANVLDIRPTTELYNKFFNSISQSDLNQCAENFLNRFTVENLKKIKEINAKYKENLKEDMNDEEKPYLHGSNIVLTNNINFVETLQKSSRAS